MLWMLPPAYGQLVPMRPILPEEEKNINLRIGVDQHTLKAYEPLYLSLVAEHFAQPVKISVTITPPGGPPNIDLGELEGKWDKTDGRTPTGLNTHRMSTVLVGYEPVPGTHRFLLAEPGQYNIRVRVGKDEGNFKMLVQPDSVANEKAFVDLGADQFPEIFAEAAQAPPSAKLIDACQGILDNYPGTVCAEYCRGYMAIAQFKQAFKKSQKTGGREVYQPLAEELRRALAPHQKRSYGEQLAFFTAYACGLCGDFDGSLRAIDSVKLRLTVWGDNLDQMKTEIQRHVRPMPVPVPVDLAPATTLPSP